MTGALSALVLARHPDEETRYQAVLRLDGAVGPELK